MKLAPRYIAWIYAWWLQQVTYSSSVDIRPEWPVVESIPFTSLAKLNFQVGKPEDIAFCGSLEYYDKVYDRVTPKADRPLKRTNKVFKSVTTSDDPVIRYNQSCAWPRPCTHGFHCASFLLF